jgi:hypothetical protein
MPKKEPKVYNFAEYPEEPARIKLLDGKERRIRLTLATVKRFEHFQILETRADVQKLDYDQVAEFIWAVLLDKQDLLGPESILELVTAAMIPDIVLAIQDAAVLEGEQLKNGYRRVQERLNGPAFTPSPESSSVSPPANSGATPLVNSPH